MRLTIIQLLLREGGEDYTTFLKKSYPTGIFKGDIVYPQ